MKAFTIRPARPDEAGIILDLIKQLAVYERCENDVVADEATLRQSLFEERSAEVVLAEEDLFVIPEKRGLGYGKALLRYVAKLAVARNCGRMEWICLDWNEPSLRIYRFIGAVPMSEWTVQRLDEQALKAFAK